MRANKPTHLQPTGQTIVRGNERTRQQLKGSVWTTKPENSTTPVPADVRSWRIAAVNNIKADIIKINRDTAVIRQATAEIRNLWK